MLRLNAPFRSVGNDKLHCLLGVIQRPRELCGALTDRVTQHEGGVALGEEGERNRLRLPVRAHHICTPRNHKDSRAGLIIRHFIRGGGEICGQRNAGVRQFLNKSPHILTSISDLEGLYLKGLEGQLIAAEFVLDLFKHIGYLNLLCAAEEFNGADGVSALGLIEPDDERLFVILAGLDDLDNDVIRLGKDERRRAEAALADNGGHVKLISGLDNFVCAEAAE